MPKKIILLFTTLMTSQHIASVSEQKRQDHREDMHALAIMSGATTLAVGGLYCFFKADSLEQRGITKASEHLFTASQTIYNALSTGEKIGVAATALSGSFIIHRLWSTNNKEKLYLGTCTAGAAALIVFLNGLDL